MDVITLQSGSAGNCTYVESNGVALLLDAGISGRQAETRLAAHGRRIGDAHGVIISHDHHDHVCAMGIYQRKFGLPVYVSDATLQAASAKSRLGKLHDVRHFHAGSTLRFEHITVETIPTPHDAADGVGFVVDDGRRRVGVLTDLGHAFAGLVDVIRSLDAVILESNYDTDMLESGYYPQMLKSRIQGQGGHLSNDQSARLLRDAGCSRLQWVCLAHLSQDNNHPELALATHRRMLGGQLPLVAASRTGASEPMAVC